MREYLKELRTAKNMTQREAAEKIGMKPNYYCMIEKGSRKQKLDLETAEKIAELFHLDLKEIVELERRISS